MMPRGTADASTSCRCRRGARRGASETRATSSRGFAGGQKFGRGLTKRLGRSSGAEGAARWPGGARAGPAVTHHQQPLFRNARSSREGFRPAHGDGTRRERGKSDAPAQGRPSRRRCPSAVRWPWCLVCDWRYRVLARSRVTTEIEQSRIRSPYVVLRLKIARRSVRSQFDKNEKSRENDASVSSPRTSSLCTFSELSRATRSSSPARLFR